MTAVLFYILALHLKAQASTHKGRAAPPPIVYIPADEPLIASLQGGF